MLSEDGPGGAPSASTVLVRSAAAQTAVEAVVSMLFMTWRDGVLSTSSRHAVERGFAFTCVGSELHGRPVRPGGPKSVENFGKRTTFNHLHTTSVGARRSELSVPPEELLRPLGEGSSTVSGKSSPRARFVGVPALFVPSSCFLYPLFPCLRPTCGPRTVRYGVAVGGLAIPIGLVS